MTKALLISGIIALVLGMALNSGLINVGDADMLYTVLPTGAVLLGLYLILRVLEKEAAQFDAEHNPPPTGGSEPK
jgi:hypothetical protein